MKKNIQADKKSVLFPEYFRVGDHFYQTIISYNGDEPYLKRVTLKKSTLVDMKGREFVDNIPSYNDCIVWPSHLDYQPVISKPGHGTYVNMYHRLNVQPKQGRIETWEKLVNHIGGIQSEMLWDYIQLLYTKPTQILPVLCLVSSENGTGKTTFANALSYLFGQNVGFYGESELDSQFSTWILSLVAVFEEISDTAKSLNKIKGFSTARNATVNAKYQPLMHVTPFVKIVILSNNEESVIKATEHDIRYWVIKVPLLSDAEYDPEFEHKLREEAPAVLHYLQSRKLSTEEKSRMWFAPELLQTSALREIIEESRSNIIKELEAFIEEKVADIGSFYATPTVLRSVLSSKYDIYEISKALKKMGYKQEKQMRFTDLWGVQKNGKPYFFEDKNGAIDDVACLDDEKDLPL